MLILAAVVAAGIGIWLVAAFPRKSTAGHEKITIAGMSHSFTTYVVFVAVEKGYFRNEGLDVTLDTSYPHGNAILRAVVEGEADFGVSSETPFMHAVLRGEKICAFATMFKGEKHLAIVARKDRGIFSVSDLKGKKVGVTLGTNGEYFLDTILLFNGISQADVQRVDLKPGQMFDSIVDGGLDAIATWNPQMYRAQKELGEKASVFYADGVYRVSFLISAKKEYVRENQRIIEKGISALLRACEFIRSHPDESREIVAGHLDIVDSLLEELSAIYHFRISLDQSLLLTLENQSKWAIAHNLTDQTEAPDYMDFLCTNALEAVEPEAVTIIR